MHGCTLLGLSVSIGLLQDAGTSAADTLRKDGCTITAKACTNFPEFSRMQFRDHLGEEHLETGSDDGACLKRAEDFHHWCGNGASGGAQVAATFNPRNWSQVYHPGACDKGWSQWDAFCYKYFWEMKTWPEAEALCRQHDSHLVSIHSHAENRFVAALQQGLKGWIGYSDLDKDTHYQWSDNTQDDFTNFAKNCTGREHEPDCQKEEVAQQWYSSSGVETSPYTCKRNVLVPGLSLLKNTSAKQLTETAWAVLIPSLASASVKEIGITAADKPPALKMPEIPPVSPGAAQDAAEGSPAPGIVPETRFALPKGSFL
mmetsp:Transcript_146650/g.258476  ORF Transcript_146650/g.258476 Transcript_146650/m.258476 type:complete len:315 (+) Transcript_146650:73-1017(+)